MFDKSNDYEETNVRGRLDMDYDEKKYVTIPNLRNRLIAIHKFIAYEKLNAKEFWT